MTTSNPPWRPPLFDLLATPRERRALGVPAPAREAAAYLRAFLAEPERWSYAVIDEMIDDDLGMVISPWPSLDEMGRLRGPTDAVCVHVELDDLQRFVDRHRQRAGEVRLLDPGLVGRPIRIGDAFALSTEAPRRRGLRVTADEGDELWLGGVPGPKGTPLAEGVVLDLSYDAREASRVAYYAAMAPLLDAERDADIVAGSALTGVEKALRG